MLTRLRNHCFLIKIVKEIAGIFSFNVPRTAKCSLLCGWLISVMAQEDPSLACRAFQQELAEACKDQWEEGWDQAPRQDGLNLARQGLRVNDLQPHRGSRLLHVSCVLLTYQHICRGWVLSLSLFFGDKKKKKEIPHDCPITLVIHYLYAIRLERKASAHARVRGTDSLKGC